jgi:hypothetical protein
MINAKSQPVGWALLLAELDEAQEHLVNLVNELNAAGQMDDDEFAIHLGHIYAHLNRIWHARNQDEGVREDQWTEFSQFPNDVKPVG